ncbi:hypothetical protein, partial [Aeromonas caviae]|uniref:hypothetical protein n=1 Tax=Aeromonas caviae TaxID=648 RepID=UPI001CC4256C
LAAREHGRDYLKGRGISPDTIEHAEKAGMVRYADGGVLRGACMVVADEQHATVCIAHHARLLGVLDGVRAD